VSIKIHPSALVVGAEIGDYTQIWAHVHLMPGAKVGANCSIGDGTYIEGGAVLGNRVTVKNQVMVWEGVEIADDVFLGPGVCFTNDRFPRSPRMPGRSEWYEDKSNWLSHTRVDQGASLGARAVILCGIHLGAYCMVAAGSVVTKNVSPHRLVAGNPAKAVGWVNHEGLPLTEADDFLLEPRSGRRYRYSETQTLDELS